MTAGELPEVPDMPPRGRRKKVADAPKAATPKPRQMALAPPVDEVDSADPDGDPADDLAGISDEAVASRMADEDLVNPPADLSEQGLLQWAVTSPLPAFPGLATIRVLYELSLIHI